MTSLFLLALTPAATAQDKIVNGQEALPGAFPEVVQVRVGSGTCTGSVIHPRWVLTAAHCFDGADLTALPNGGARVDIGVGGVVGFERTIESDAVVVHPRYVALASEQSQVAWSSTGSVAPDGVRYDAMTHDLALVRLSEAYNGTLMALNPTPVDASWIDGQVRTTQVGFGITVNDGDDEGTKRIAEDVPVVGYSDAPPEGNWGVSFFDVVDGRSTCQGDSGGPSVLRVGEDAYVQIGVTSYGIRCGLDASTSMRVDPYLAWILGARDGAFADGEITPDEHLTPEDALYRDPSLWVPSILTEAAGPPTIACSHQLDPTAATSIALGVVPFELRCTAGQPDLETLDRVTWHWGDGSTADVRTDDLQTAEHTYTEMGVYTLRACFEGQRGDHPYEQCVVRQNHVTACDLPEASFEVDAGDGLVLELRNLTSLQAHTCVTNARWEVYAGDAASGEPVLTRSGWEPRLALPAPGTYTVVLNVGGLAGTAAASAPVQVRRTVGRACSATTALPLVATAMLLPLLGLRRRKGADPRKR